MEYGEYFKELMKNPEFAKSLEESQACYRLAEKFHEKRNELGMTMKELAERCNVSEDIIEDVEFANFENVNTKNLKKIAEVLKIDISNLSKN